MTNGRSTSLLVAACCLLSLATSVLVCRRQGNIRSDLGTIRAQRIELLDDKGVVRARLGMVGNEPVLSFVDRFGVDLLQIGTERYGHGLIKFNETAEGYERLGVIRLGYLSASDTDSAEDPLGAWGLRVSARQGVVLGLGMTKDGAHAGLTLPTSK